MSADQLREAADIGIGMHIVLGDVEWRVTGVKRLQGGAREFFLMRDGDISRTTRQDTDLVRCRD